MKRTLVSVHMATVLVLALAPAAFSGDLPAAPAASKPPGGLVIVEVPLKDHMPRWLQLGVQIRGRFEGPSGTSLANGASDNYYLSRMRVDLAVKPLPGLTFFVQAQDARVAAYNTAPAPTTLYNPMDLRQGYVAWTREGKLGVELRAGRQELAFGGERLIGPADWGMSRTFDAVDLSLSRGASRLDLFAGSAVQIDNTRFDRHKAGEHFYGAYGSIRNVLPSMNIEPYVLFKQSLLVKGEGGSVGDGLVASPGLRIAGKAPGRVDYIAEVVAQRGSYADDRVTAIGQSYTAGWTIVNSALKPRLSVEYSYASGDPTQKDGTRGTFDQFYPSNHSNYGMIDQFGWKNLKNWRAGFDLVAWKKLKFRTDFNEFYLATVEDSLYASSGSSAVLNRKATSGHIGSELNAVALYQWNKIWKFGAGCGRLFAGDFLKQSKVDFGYTYPYLMFMGTF